MVRAAHERPHQPDCSVSSQHGFDRSWLLFVWHDTPGPDCGCCVCGDCLGHGGLWECFDAFGQGALSFRRGSASAYGVPAGTRALNGCAGGVVRWFSLAKPRFTTATGHRASGSPASAPRRWHEKSPSVRLWVKSPLLAHLPVRGTEGCTGRDAIRWFSVASLPSPPANFLRASGSPNQGDAVDFLRVSGSSSQFEAVVF